MMPVHHHQLLSLFGGIGNDPLRLHSRSISVTLSVLIACSSCYSDFLLYWGTPFCEASVVVSRVSSAISSLAV